jgi:hypothetical protein
VNIWVLTGREISWALGRLPSSKGEFSFMEWVYLLISDSLIIGEELLNLSVHGVLCFVFFTAFFSTNFIQTSELNKCAHLQLQVENPIKIQWESIWFCIYILMITVSPLFLTAVESELYFLSFMEGPVHTHLHHYNCESSYVFTLQMTQFRAAVCVCENSNGVRMTCHWDLKSDNVRT